MELLRDAVFGFHLSHLFCQLLDGWFLCVLLPKLPHPFYFCIFGLFSYLLGCELGVDLVQRVPEEVDAALVHLVVLIGGVDDGCQRSVDVCSKCDAL